MRKLLIIMLIILVPAVSFSQAEVLSKKELRKAQKEEKKKQANQEAQADYTLVSYILDNRQFVLEADMVSDDEGFMRTADPNINFIMVDSLYGAIQLGNRSDAGWNNVGGITVEGKVMNYTVNKDEKKKIITVEFELKTMVSDFFRVKIYTQSGMRADARFKGRTGNQLRYTGTLVPLDQSPVYKGRVTY